MRKLLRWIGRAVVAVLVFLLALGRPTLPWHSRGDVPEHERPRRRGRRR